MEKKMETEMETREYRGFRGYVESRDMTPIMENDLMLDRGLRGSSWGLQFRM